VKTLDPTFDRVHDHAAALRAADADLCRALSELQVVLDRQELADGELPKDDLYRDWLLSLNVIRDALQAVERIANLLVVAAATAPKD
jgi:hypothetical protein